MTDPSAEQVPAWSAPNLDSIMGTEPSTRRRELRRAGDAMRSLIEHLIATAAPEAAIVALADRVEALAADLGAYPKRTHMETFFEGSTSGDVHAFFDDSPLLGIANPLAPPLELHTEGEGTDRAVVGRATFGSAYEGPPGCVHGGFIAASFDEVLGLAQSIAGNPGLTGWLHVSYRSPTPLHTELSYRGVVESVEGRKIRCTGTLHAGERLCAEAEALFISVDFEKMRALADLAETRRTAGR